MVFVLKQRRCDIVKLLKRGAITGNSPVHGDVLKPLKDLKVGFFDCGG